MLARRSLASCNAALGHRPSSQLQKAVSLTAAQTLLGSKAGRACGVAPGAGCRLLRARGLGAAAACMQLSRNAGRQALGAAEYSRCRHESCMYTLSGVQLDGCQLFACEYRGRGFCAKVGSGDHHGVVPTC